MKILVTGGTGYIGSHTAIALMNAGFDVMLIDNLSNSYEWIVDRIERVAGKRVRFVKVDLTDNNTLTEFFAANNDFDGVVHFAALKAVGDSVRYPLKYYHNNLASLMNLLHQMEKYKITNLVFSSSCTVYGDVENLPVNETAPVKRALSPYGNTKIVSEELIADQVKISNLNSISLRYFNPIGAHPSGIIGELPLGVPNNLMPYITQTAIGKRECLKVFGNDYPTPDGTPIRDYIHICDLADAHLVALKRLLNNECEERNEVFNIGTGKGYSVLEVINTFIENSGVELKYEVVERRKGDVPAIWADPSKAFRFLNWKTKFELNEMVASAWKWEKTLQKEADLIVRKN